MLKLPEVLGVAVASNWLSWRHTNEKNCPALPIPTDAGIYSGFPEVLTL